MATNVKIILNKRRQRKDNKYPIILRLIHNRNTLEIPLNYSVREDDWGNGEIKKSCKEFINLSRVNNHIQKRKAEAIDIINRLIDNKEINNYSVRDLRNIILNKGKNITFCEYTKSIVEELKEANKLGNASAYFQSMNFVLRHNDDRDMYFEEINFKWLKKVELRHLAKGRGYNGLSFYYRTLRAIFNRAIKENIIKPEIYPFKTYTIKNVKTKKRAISKEDIEKIKDLKLKPFSALWHARNYFMFSFYLMGINFTDMAYLKKKDIVNDRIEYKRRKTGQDFSIKLIEPAKNILSHYLKNKKKEHFILPILKHKLPEQQRTDIDTQIRFYNRRLKKIANQCKIEANLTSYVARHSWGTIARKINIPISVISQGYGHENEKTTEIYLASFEHDVIDKANELITA